jgi:hypothetical protein
MSFETQGGKEDHLGAALRLLPDLRAPMGFQKKVMAVTVDTQALAAPRAWWSQPIQVWPRPMQASFLAVLLVVVILVIPWMNDLWNEGLTATWRSLESAVELVPSLDWSGWVLSSSPWSIDPILALPLLPAYCLMVLAATVFWRLTRFEPHG